MGGGDLRREQLDNGGLARAGRAHQEYKLPVLNAQVDPPKGLGAVVVFFMYVDQSYHGPASPCHSQGLAHLCADGISSYYIGFPQACQPGREAFQKSPRRQAGMFGPGGA